MSDKDHKTPDASPFHAGEQELQARVGKRDDMERLGRRVIRSFMPDQHRDFFESLPFLVVGGVDRGGWPWASLISGRPGFMRTPDARTLQINGALPAGDPLGGVLQPGAPIGLLGIEPATRRRNRANGLVAEQDGAGFSVAVKQSFGNCPQYIQTRAVDFVRDPADGGGSEPEAFTTLGADHRGLIAAANTFFVASATRSHGGANGDDVDVSHRGGRAGFVKVDGDTLTVPDYPGNYHFNTLGNFLVNPRAGLTFVDFERGNLLSLTGTVELVEDGDVEVAAFKGAERAWRFTLDHGVYLEDALPFRAPLQDYSPNALLAGDWQQAAATLAAQARREAWRPYRVARTRDESRTVRSLYLEAADGDGDVSFEAGQFLTLRVTPEGCSAPVMRTYTVSSKPGDVGYRISVKREPQGLVSRHLHDVVQVGDVVEIKAPSGGFFIDATETRPAVLLAGGIGITPMLSMAAHVAAEGIRTRHLRPLTILHAAQTTAERAFAEPLRALEAGSGGAIRYFSVISRPEAGETPGEDFNGAGRITADTLRQVLSLDDYDFYLCGPGPFMQALYDALRTLGVRDGRIHAEAFGPASLRRAPDVGHAVFEPGAEADAAVVRFARSGFEQGWQKGGDTLLETAEQHGLAPAYGCRSGSCGSCAVKLKAGAVAYRTQPTAPVDDDDVLICCAVPAEGAEHVELDL